MILEKIILNKCLYTLGSKWKSIQIAEIIEHSYYVTYKEIRSSFLLERMFGRFYNAVSNNVYMSRRVYKRTPPCLYILHDPSHFSVRRDIVVPILEHLQWSVK